MEGGKVYGRRKLHDDLLEQGERIRLDVVARLTRLAGIKAQIGYERRPGKYGGKLSSTTLCTDSSTWRHRTGPG